MSALNPFAAFDPRSSALVSASAGSGKTTLLTRRVLRLLLEEPTSKNRPGPNILCLTYTRAAAAEMQDLIHKRLADWAIMEDGKLRDELAELFGLKADKDIVRRAQRLFTQILDEPQQLRVMTVHAFCQYILHSFPIEAGLLPHFTLLEGQEVERFQDEAISELFFLVRGNKELAKAFKILAAGKSNQTIRKLLAQIFFNSAEWERFWRKIPDGAAYRAHLLKEAGLEAGEESALLARFIKAVPETKLKLACQILSGGSKTDKQRGEKIAAWLGVPDTRAAGFSDYCRAYLTKEGDIYAKLATEGLKKAYPDIENILQEEAVRVLLAQQRLALLGFINRQVAFFALAESLWQVAAQLKAQRAVLTYDDLILKTRDLLSRPTLSGWILYRLDRGIDHLLIDEAQDTSPEQWQVILCLLDEFLAGEGARSDVPRTLFVVGDEKQSIYSFQGADRQTYLETRSALLARMKAAQHPMREIEQHSSYRSAAAVLSYVDAVFAPDAARSGVSQAQISHLSAREGEYGLVELWPPIVDQKLPKLEPWAPPLMREDSQPGEVMLAERIAAQIREWLDNHTELASKNRPIASDDIMILLQRRSKLLFPIVRALKDANIPVAGVDRMILNKQAAVQDVLALCRFLLLPTDDLALAEVLRGPFVRLEDTELFEAAHGREGALWEALQKNKKFAGVTEYLRELLARTDYVPPFALLNFILFTPCPGDAISGQHALTRRLGTDAIDPLEELLGLALRFEGEETPSLQLFLQSISRDEEESKREMSKITGQVKILTVHGAKGLEAPIVFVPDLSRDPHDNSRALTLYWNNEDYPLASGEGDALVPLMTAAKAEAEREREEEHRRLLYVALTRARDVMILCGIAKEGAVTAPWYEWCGQAMKALGAKTRTSKHGEEIWQHGEAEALRLPKKPSISTAKPLILPEWLRTPAPSERGMGILNPSQLGVTTEKIKPPSLRRESYKRGSLLHLLLQMLPDVAQESREKLAFDFLMRQEKAEEKTAREDVAEIMKVMNDPAFAPVFGVGSVAEVPLIGRLNGKRISGQIDRLAITDRDVLIIDYKTNRPPPKNLEEVSEAYLAQMATYHRLLSMLYSGKKVRCALLWTHIPQLMELDEAALAKGFTILEKAA